MGMEGVEGMVGNTTIEQRAGGGPCLFATINKNKFKRFTEMKGKGKNAKPMVDRKTPCWWDNTQYICAKCKPNGKPCGFPMHRWCQNKNSKVGCQGIPENKNTLSSKGYPCYWDLTDTSCAWCVRNRAQCKDSGKSRCGRFCGSAADQRCDGVYSTCNNIPTCGTGASCFKKSGECKCKKGLKGNGFQCRDPKTGEFATDPASQVEISIDTSSKFFVFPEGSNQFNSIEL